MSPSIRLVGPGIASLVLAATVVVSVLDAPARAVPLGPYTIPSMIRASERPSIVLIVTDDQRWDTLSAMPSVERLLVDQGVTFENAFVVNSLCCPSRASILTGDYSHTTGVYTNGGDDGGFEGFHDASTVATWLDDDGYQTGLFGKYLNMYPGRYVPPGWDSWNAIVMGPRRGGYYFDWTLGVGTGLRDYGHDPRDYSTSVLASRAARFIRSAADGPLFLYFAPWAPHGPLVPAPGDARAFDDLFTDRPPSFGEPVVEDKPEYVRNRPASTDGWVAAVDRYRRGQYETLLAVDRAVGSLVRALSESGRLDSTMIVFTSDNGFAWGEHRWLNKQTPYEESIRVPLVVRYPRLGSEPRTVSQLALNIDLAPTFADVAGVPTPHVDGRSLVPLLAGESAPWRNAFLIEHASTGGTIDVPSYCVVRSTHELYAVYATGEEEYYDLATDPFQDSNLAGNPSTTGAQAALEARFHRMCDPPPPGMGRP
jgi:N-acetylglucosamine-6-sulfatase